MLSLLFSRQIDNAYQGQFLAIWIFTPVVLMKMAMGFNVAGLNPWVSSRFIIQAADGVPIDSFPADAAALLVFMFQSWGLALLVLALLSVVVLVRYRAMLPLMILAIGAEQVGRKLISSISFPPDPNQALSVAAMINWGFSAALVLAFALSLWRRGAATA